MTDKLNRRCTERVRSSPVPDVKHKARINLDARLEFTADGLDLPNVIEELERSAISEALRRTGGVVTVAARSLHITRRMLRYKMIKLHIRVKE
jgi:transcriptional regulator with GAF, ATPase, and Fis domain